MYRYLKLSFDDIKGRSCGRCMLSFSKGERNHCSALGNRPICPEEGCRDDCPLINNVVDLPVIDVNDERYREIMTYNNCICAEYTRNDYRDLLKTQGKDELLQLQVDIDQKIKRIQLLYEGLLQKKLACEDVLEQLE